eukprot:COSAG01_NODE_401_length_17529_cov_47.865806_17_plen_71_part_00
MVLLPWSLRGTSLRGRSTAYAAALAAKDRLDHVRRPRRLLLLAGWPLAAGCWLDAIRISHVGTASGSQSL